MQTVEVPLETAKGYANTGVIATSWSSISLAEIYASSKGFRGELLRCTKDRKHALEGNDLGVGSLLVYPRSSV